MIKRTELTALSCGLALLLAAASFAQSEETLNIFRQPAPDLSRNMVRSFEPIPLTATDAVVQSPQITSRGATTAIAWVELGEEGRQRIRALSLGDARLQQTAFLDSIRTIDQSTTGHNSSPAIAINPTNHTASVAWVHNEPEENSLYYAPANGAEPSLVWQSPNIVEFPSIDFDSEGNVFLAWSVQVGGRSEVYAAVQGEEENWTILSLSSGTRPYDLLPQTFGNDIGAEVYWYSIDGSDILGRYAVLSTEGIAASERMSSVIPAFRLPILYRTETPGMGAMWLEQTDQGDVYFDLDPRNVEMPSPQIVGILGDSPAQAAVSSDITASKVWIERQPGPEVYLVAQSPYSSTVRQQVAATASEPRISVSSNWVHLVWLEENQSSGSSSLRYLRIR